MFAFGTSQCFSVSRLRKIPSIDSSGGNVEDARSAKRHISMDKADIFLPGGGDESCFADWRKTYSDHFPTSFKIKIENKDDDLDFE